MSFVRAVPPTHRHATAAGTPSDELPMLERAMLWAIRAWALGHDDPDRADAAGRRLAGLFGSLRAPAGLAALDSLMRALCHGALRTLDINCVCHDGVSADEHLLLDVLALEGAARQGDASAVLARLVDRQWAGVGCDSAGRLMTALTAAGHAMPRTADAIRRHGWTGLSGVAGSSSVH